MKRERLRGAAMVEAVILLPTLVILLLGARFVARRYETEGRALREARTCAIRFAHAGCTTMPAGCNVALEAPAPTANPDDALRGISGQLAAAERAVQRLSSVPVLGTAVGALLGKYSHAERQLPVQRLLRTAGTRLEVRGSALFPCNEVPRTDDVARQVFQSVTAPFL